MNCWISPYHCGQTGWIGSDHHLRDQIGAALQDMPVRITAHEKPPRRHRFV
jgi:hypothetical protein